MNINVIKDEGESKTVYPRTTFNDSSVQNEANHKGCKNHRRKVSKQIFFVFGGAVWTIVIVAILILPLFMQYHTKQENKSFLFFQTTPIEGDDIKETHIIQVNNQLVIVSINSFSNN